MVSKTKCLHLNYTTIDKASGRGKCDTCGEYGFIKEYLSTDNIPLHVLFESQVAMVETLNTDIIEQQHSSKFNIYKIKELETKLNAIQLKIQSMDNSVCEECKDIIKNIVIVDRRRPR